MTIERWRQIRSDYLTSSIGWNDMSRNLPDTARVQAIVRRGYKLMDAMDAELKRLAAKDGIDDWENFSHEEDYVTEFAEQ